ncbi:MAG TPA: carboxypeptidase-like regulatory domain-containing protein [Chitinophagaceae bacterium]
MKQKILYFSGIAIFLLSFSLLFTTGCQRELSDPGGGNPNPPGTSEPAVNDNEMVIGGVRGTVIDQNNRPVEGATVVSGSHTTTTDRYGAFTFSNINLSKANGYVKVTKTGYFNGSRTFISVAGRINNVRIKLLPKTNAGNFPAAAGGTINIAGGGKLVMPAAAITDAGGGAYSGTVNVAMTWIDPTSADLPYIIPGDLRGVTTGGQERGLETFGMLGVELTGNTGQALKITAGKTAELTFPIPAALQGNAPATIDLWNFDEATGRWKQEGTATKNGSYYIAQVSHFSFWNCDAPFPLVEVCMTIVSAGNNLPLNNVQVRIKRPNGSYGYGRTDSLGNLCGKVPKNEALVLEVLGQCNNVVHTQNIGPFSSNASLGTIAVTIPATNSLIITGTLVNCSNANVTNGVAVIYTGNAHSYSVPVTNGTFSLTLLRCENATVSFSVLGVDYTTLQQGNPVSGSGTTGTVNVGTIQACGTSSAEFVEFLIDGVPYAYASPPDNIFFSDSTTPAPGSATIFATKTAGSNTAYSNFRFETNGTTGIKPLHQCRISAGTLGVAEVILTPSPTVTITTWGPPVTGFVEGNFNIQMNFAGTPKTVVCTFRVRRG